MGRARGDRARWSEKGKRGEGKMEWEGQEGIGQDGVRRARGERARWSGKGEGRGQDGVRRARGGQLPLCPYGSYGPGYEKSNALTGTKTALQPFNL